MPCSSSASARCPSSGQIAYPIRNSLYLNITNRCTAACTFCVRYHTDFVKGHNLRLGEEPTAEALIKEIGDPKRYAEIVFCGYGEPLLRLDVVKAVAAEVKQRGGQGAHRHERPCEPDQQAERAARACRAWWTP